MSTKISRRRFLLGAGIAAGAVGLPWIKPGDEGASGHEDYFLRISNALKEHVLGRPAIVVDKARLIENVDVIRRHLENRFQFRIVAKSLPSIPLIKEVMDRAETNKLMVFHLPFLTAVAQQIPNADVLMGKPMPMNAVRTFYRLAPSSGFDASKQLQWLVDNPVRMQQYARLGEELQQSLLINIELDVGLHRGGVKADDELISMLNTIEQSPWLSLSGFMGYEPHIGKVPGDPLTHRDMAMSLYEHYLRTAELHLGRDLRHLTLNGAGSPTYQFYNEGAWPMNELSAGSCLVKPSDFDLDTLQDHQAAAFIATPVIKALPSTDIPGVSGLGQAMALWDPNLQQTFFTYGGYWKANPISPKGLRLNPVYGRSSNQEMLNGSARMNLQQDDFVFLRPTQSESVLLQFGDLLVYEEGSITSSWPVIAQG